MQALSTILNNVILKKMNLVIENANLDNKVNNVAILDFEFDPNLSESMEYFHEHEFVVSSLLIAKDNEDLLYSIVLNLIQHKVSGLAIRDVYYKTLPEKVMKLAKRHAFPVFFFNGNLSFEDIIYEVSYEVREGEKNSYYEQMIDGILSQNISNQKAMELFDISSKNKYYIFLIRLLQHDAYHEISKMSQGLKMYKYYNSAFIFIRNDKSLKYYLEYFSKLIAEFDYYVGMTLLRNDVSISLANAMSNLKVAYFSKRRIVTNKDEDFLHLLINNYSKTEYQGFMNNYLKPILNDENLLDTAISFVSSGGDIKESAKNMYVHENTIRYRINKLRNLLEEGASELEFYKNLSLAVNIYKLNNNNFTF